MRRLNRVYTHIYICMLVVIRPCDQTQAILRQRISKKTACLFIQNIGRYSRRTQPTNNLLWMPAACLLACSLYLPVANVCVCPYTILLCTIYFVSDYELREYRWVVQCYHSLVWKWPSSLACVSEFSSRRSKISYTY